MKKNIRKKIAGFMIMVMISSVVSNCFVSVAYASEIDGIEENLSNEEGLETEDLQYGSEENISEPESTVIDSEEDSIQPEESDSEEDSIQPEESDSEKEPETDIVRNEDSKEDGKNELTNPPVLEKIDTGWDDTETYYYINGEKVTDQVIEIDGEWYGFDDSGRVYKNESFGIPYFDETNYDWVTLYYRAKVDGSLYVNEWFNDSYYYGDKGVGVNGAVTLDGDTYLFQDGFLIRNFFGQIGETYYFSDYEGIVYKAENNALNTIGNDTYYVKNWEKITDQIKKINKKLYAFDSEGKMIKDRQGYIYTYDTYGYVIKEDMVRAHEDGTLFVNEWYEDEWDERYYYGSDGIAVDGLYEIDGKTYYFSNGWLRTNFSQEINGEYYVSDSEGIVYLIKDNDWNVIDGETYYYKNRIKVTSRVEEIDGKLYGFDYSGLLYRDTDFSFPEYDDDYNWIGWKYYYAKADGSLYRNEWFQPEWCPKFYYKDDGSRMEDGVCSIDNKLYLFKDSAIWQNGIYDDGDTCYVSDADGVATATDSTGWISVGGENYYRKNGKLLKDQVAEIDGKLYGFDYYGKKYEDSLFSVYVSDSESAGGNRRQVYYYAQANGELLTNSWFERWGSKTYLTKDGSVPEGLYTIDGVTYLFANGYLLENSSYEIDGKVYLSDENGVVQTAEKDGWITVGNNTYYFEKGVMVKNQIKKINRKYYVFNDAGVRVTDATWSLSEYDETGNWVSDGHYRAKSDGSLYMNEWYSGTDWEGKYYYGKDGKALQGFQTIDGKNYYFDDYSGRLYTDDVVEIDNDKYIADESGVLFIIKEDGWLQTDGRIYYIENGEPFRQGGLKEIDGVTYAFSYDGYVYQNMEVMLRDPTTWTRGYYRTREDGSIIRGSWDDEKEKYYREDGNRVQNTIYKIGKKYYMFGVSGELMRNTVMTVDGKAYLSDDKGIVKEISDGWHEGKDADGEYRYYIRNGIMLKNGEYEIEEKTGTEKYVFDAFGHLAINQGFARVNISSSNSGNPYDNSGNSGNPYADPDAPVMNYTHSVGYVTASNNNYAVYETATCNAYNPYRTDDTGRLLRNTWFDDTADGFPIRSYFDETGKKVAGWLQLDGDSYYFDMLGIMQTGLVKVKYVNGKYDGYYFAKDGKQLKNTWGRDGSKWYHFDADGKMQRNMWLEDGGNKYYLGEDGARYVGTFTIDGKNCYFDKDGIYIENGPKKLDTVFDDIKVDTEKPAWYLGAVRYVYEYNIMSGKGNSFKPNSYITRGEFVRLLYNHAGAPEKILQKNIFPDVKDDAWYTNAVLWAKKNDIASGNGDGTFGVNNDVQRMQVALMLYKYAKLCGYDTTVSNPNAIDSFSDANKVPSWAKNAMNWAVSQGIINGKGGNRLDPTGKATRAECAQMIMKLVEANK